ncbi:neurogenic differentiation factor 2-like [Varroa jacobsoni]|nr:neurogenic differentiation factor 2-like isoform X2 [Varroa destructor]XP_022646875.1 neurogenic differentiation factor 2-like isoform X2 [Varroa destructor]XP_022646876.1 neurogenic differentiation factor 2-like isoform X2 [Varroa destructor]XP_022646877.1 neurogenic differentiation factor 2-like isoform X2 [Varroa destructor]XP_022646878.1 neurogenic differentiation factor 2-like isoform X2 [Varroa destructor]XP_022646879.1 neurogenic differentiation factor 2-like isoform X2 [Varroa destr
MAFSETTEASEARRTVIGKVTTAPSAAQDAAKEVSDEDSGVEMILESRQSSSSCPSFSPASSIITRKYLLQHQRKTIHPKERSHSELQHSFCSDSSVSDQERPGSHDSGLRLGTISPDGSLDLSFKIGTETFSTISRVSNCDVGVSRGSSLSSSRPASINVVVASQPKRIKLESDSQVVRQRRIEANARERTRVHTIGAAFESLRKAIPAYSNGQKLSKLAILRVASSYILALSSLLEDSHEGFEDAVQACSSAIHLDGKVRKR